MVREKGLGRIDSSLDWDLQSGSGGFGIIWRSMDRWCVFWLDSAGHR